MNAFFGELAEGAAETLEAVSMDLGPAYAKSVRTHAPQATVCFDPFYGDLRVMPRWGLSCLVGMLPAARRSA